MGNAESTPTPSRATATSTLTIAATTMEASNSSNEQNDELASFALGPITVTSPTRRRSRRHTHPSNNRYPYNGNALNLDDDDDAWWWEIENENLTLDQVPIVTTTTGTTIEEESADKNDNDCKEKESVEINNELLAIKIAKGEMESVVENSNESITKPTMATPTTTITSSVESNTTFDKMLSNASSTLHASRNDDERTPSPSSVATMREQTLEEFKEELRVKRLARQTAVQDLRDEITTLRKQLATEQALTRSLMSNNSEDDKSFKINEMKLNKKITQEIVKEIETIIKNDEKKAKDNENVNETDSNEDAERNNEKLKEKHNKTENDDNEIENVAGAMGFDDATIKLDVNDNEFNIDADDEDPISRGRHANIELADAQLALQLANSENLSLRTELGVVQKQVGTLKEVISCCKQMLAVKEEQCDQLKEKLQEIETSFAERELKIMSNNLRQEYERQLGNIRQLRELYEERQRISAAEHENLQRLISIKRDELLAEQEKCRDQ